MCLQVCNVEKPNSILNTSVFRIFKAQDIYTNLRIALHSLSKEVFELREARWDSKCFCLLGFGNCEFISKCLGLAGATATYPCFLCNIHRNVMQAPRKDCNVSLQEHRVPSKLIMQSLSRAVPK